MPQVNSGPPGGDGFASPFVQVFEYNRTIAAGQTFTTDTLRPLRASGYPNLSFYVVVTQGAAGLASVLEEFAPGRNPQTDAVGWLPIRTAYAAALLAPTLNGAVAAHTPPAYLPGAFNVRMSLTAGVNDVQVTWYIAASS